MRPIAASGDAFECLKSIGVEQPVGDLAVPELTRKSNGKIRFPKQPITSVCVSETLFAETQATKSIEERTPVEQLEAYC